MIPYKMMRDNWNDMFSEENQSVKNDFDDTVPTWLAITIIVVLVGSVVIKCIVG
jgi:hypothetical protein